MQQDKITKRVAIRLTLEGLDALAQMELERIEDTGTVARYRSEIIDEAIKYYREYMRGKK